LQFRRGGREVDLTAVYDAVRAQVFADVAKPRDANPPSAAGERSRPPLAQTPDWLKEILRRQEKSSGFRAEKSK
jgi:hypothetical protein